MRISKKNRILPLATCALLLAFSPALQALGLGEARVRSYLGQRLDVHLRLISQSEEELGAVTAGLASAADFEIVGLDLAALSVPLRFEIEAAMPEPYIRVTSALPVNDPVIQFVAEITFPGGRMLREYTLFLDPPTFAAPVPLPAQTPGREAPATPERIPAARPAPAIAAGTPEPGTPVSAEPLPAPAPAVTPAPAGDAVADRVETPAGDSPGEAVPEPGAMEPEEVAPQRDADDEMDQAAAEEAASADEAPDEVSVAQDAEVAGEEIGVAPEAPAEPETPSGTPAVSEAEPPDDPVEYPPQAAPVVYRAPDHGGETYGPVASGETMWGIASEFTRDTGYSINQAMLAIQRQNPDAFINNNINALKRGAILRLPTAEQMSAMSNRDAMLEAMRQEAEYRNRAAGVASTPPPAVADIAPEPGAETVVEADVEPPPPEPDGGGRLELVPPSGADELARAGESGTGPGEGGGNAVQSREQDLARTEEELANAQQENEYLSNRIRELEAQLAELTTGGSVEDTGLAELESRLREERLSAEPEAPVAVVRPRETQPWYGGKTGWIIAVLALLALLAVGLAWMFRRLRGGGPGGAPGSGGDTVRLIKDEAEEVLRVLDQGPERAEDAGNVIDLERYVEPGHREDQGRPDRAEEAGAAPQEEPPTAIMPGHGRADAPPDDEEAVELDSDDPETKLDLARAYISVGDFDAARVMLEEVIREGNEDQVAEAGDMMTEL